MPHLLFLWAFCVFPFLPHCSIPFLSSHSFCWRLQDPFCHLALLHWGDSTLWWTSPLHPQLLWGSSRSHCLALSDPSPKDSSCLNHCHSSLLLYLFLKSQRSANILMPPKTKPASPGALSRPHYPFPSPSLKYSCRSFSANGPNGIHQAAARDVIWRETCIRTEGSIKALSVSSYFLVCKQNHVRVHSIHILTFCRGV